LRPQVCSYLLLLNFKDISIYLKKLNHFNMNSISLPQLVQRKEDNVMATNLGDELVMMDTQSGNYITLNDLGRVIWEKIEQPISVNDLTHYLLSKYNVTEEQCKTETYAFLEKLQTQGLLV